MMKLGQYKHLLSFIIILIIVCFVLVSVLICLTPPIARDALIHHLAIPKLWIQHGGFYETPWAPYSYFPMNVDLLYWVSLYFGNDIVPHFIHLGFGLGTALMVYLYLRWRLNHIAGLLGFLIFISTPVINKLSTMAYVDLGLVFFTTASVLSFICWREGGYKRFSWLLVASVAMGLALGTKYNALIAWFFLTLAVVFVCSRDTGRSGKAAMHGFIFFIISVVIFSPWMIKNAFLTGNPLYPLFPGLFNSSISEGGTNTVAFGYTHIGMFKMRQYLYGESFWDIILIPVRMFFQGQDDSPRYFDGVLNPILVIFVPFAFMKKAVKVENMLLLFFSLFFILMTFFLDQIRIRYILPAIPFFIILSVTGLVNLFGWLAARQGLLQKICMSGLVTLVLVFIFINFEYMQKYYFKIDPVKYIIKKESRDEFIARHDASYPAIMYINKNTDKNSRIRLILLAGRGYYLDRLFQDDPSRGIAVIYGMLDHSGNDDMFQRYLVSLDCTHLLIRYDLFKQFIQDNVDVKRAERLKRQMNRNMKIIYNDHKYIVFRIIDL